MKKHVDFGILSRFKAVFLLAVLFIAWSAMAAEGTTYYVSASGDDAKDGLSAETAFATLAKAVETANADDTTEEVVVLGDLVTEQSVEITGGYLLKGQTTDPADTVVSAEGTLSPVVKVSHPKATVAHLTITGGFAHINSGGNISLNGGGTVTNCVIRDSKTGNTEGGGVRNENGLVTHCVIENCTLGFNRDQWTRSEGAGLYQLGEKAVTEYCTIRGNRMREWKATGAGAVLAGGTIRHCVITNNSALGEIGTGGYYVGGVYLKGSSTMEHCLVADNNALECGGLQVDGSGNVVRNCTITRNRARSVVAGVRNSGNNEFRDLIVIDNEVFNPPAEPQYNNVVGGGTWVNTLSDTAIGENAKVSDPMFEDPENNDFTLSPFSPARCAGTDGCDLGYAPFDTSVYEVHLAPLPPKALPAGELVFQARAYAGEGPMSYRWKMDDLLLQAVGEWGEWGVDEFHHLTLAGGHYRLSVESKDWLDRISTASVSFYVGPKKVYLVPADTAGNTPVAPFDSVETAANDINEAIRYCADGTELLASDGDYGVTHELDVPAKATIRSENGPGKTSIYRIGDFGKGTPSRVVHLHGNGATLSGFAVTNGFLVERSGSNVLLEDDDVVTNCLITKGYAGDTGPQGAIISLNGQIRDTVIRANEGFSDFGGAVYLAGPKSVLADCAVTNHFDPGNWYGRGIGVYAFSGATIERCVIRDNKNASVEKGGKGGGVYLSGSTIRDSVIAENRIMEGGGIYAEGYSPIINCTIAYNEAKKTGGLVTPWNYVVHNTVFYGNMVHESSGSRGDPSWKGLDGQYGEVSFIAVPDEGACLGTGSFVLQSEPMFTDKDAGDYSIRMDSPLRDKGDNGDRLETERDAAGNPRIVGDAIDIGAYEYQIPDELSCILSVTGFDTVGNKVKLEATVEGSNLNGLEYRWRVFDEIHRTESWTMWDNVTGDDLVLAPGRYSFTLNARNSAGKVVTFTDGKVYNVVSPKVYVVPQDKALGEPAYPYDSWKTAANDIPTALTAAGNGSTALVTNGEYAVDVSVVLGAGVRLISVNGPDKTSIYRPYPRKTVQPVYQIVQLEGANGVFSGFTVSNGLEGVGVEWGCAIMNHEGTVSNCVVSYNMGNAPICNWDGLVTHCLVEHNEDGTTYGLGLYQQGAKARTERCEIANNWHSSGYYCKGTVNMTGGVLSDCVITNNSLVNTEATGGNLYRNQLEWRTGLQLPDRPEPGRLRWRRGLCEKRDAGELHGRLQLRGGNR